MMKSMLFLAATTALACVAADVLLGTSCEKDADCQASTNRCYFGRGTGGSCQCNPITNAGCAGNEICSDRPTWVDGFPACVDPSTLDQIGEKCDFDEDCVTKRCFRGFQPRDAPGSCQCNSQTNAGCPESKICSDAPLAYDGSPECVDADQKPDDLPPLGSPCVANDECQTGSCFFGMDSVEGEPGLCQCNSETNSGCADGEICLPTPGGLLGSLVCVEGLSEEPLPIGSECFEDTQCASGACWYGYQPLGSPGSCRCNLLTNAGCEDLTPICWDDPRIADEAPQCISTSSPLGSDCFIDSQCASDSCFISSLLPPGFPGVCACNLLTNAACGGDTSLCWDNPIIEDESPQCTTASLPLGSECFIGQQCASGSCFISPELQFGSPGVCDCNLLTNAGCDEGEATLCWDNPFIEDEPPECIDPATLLGIGDQCENNDECATLRCFQGNSATKVCACNSNTNAGCPEGQICSDEPTFVDGFPVCRLRGGGQIGDQCKENVDCRSLRCFRGEQLPDTPGTCACNSNSNAGCPEGQVCSDEPTSVDGLPECREQNGGQIGDECEVDEDCNSNRCYRGRQVLDTPGSCRCNSSTNAGCPVGQECTDEEPTVVDRFPECREQTGGQIGDECQVDEDCSSNRCYEDPQAPDARSCRCDPLTNSGCFFFEFCSDRPTETGGQPECLRDEDVSLSDIIFRLFMTILEWILSLF